MAVIRVQKTSNYTVMSNRHFKEKSMSLKAKGLLSLMLSLPDDWDYTVSGLVAICKEGTKAVQSTLSELEEFGYLKRTRAHGDKGLFEYIYDIYEQPQAGSPQTEEPQTEKGCMDEGRTDKSQQLNTKESNTNISNTKDKKKERKKDTYDSIIESMVDDEEIKETLVEFTKMRKLAKKPMTNRALTMLINKLKKMSSDKDMQIKILEQSILHNWLDIYPYKGGNGNNARNIREDNKQLGDEYAEFG